MTTKQELNEIKHIQELSDELMNIVQMDNEMPIGDLQGILEARVKKNCPDMKSLSSKVKQNCIEIRERTDDEQIHGLTDSILFHLKK